MFGHITTFVRGMTGKFTLCAVLAGAGTAATAQAHDHLELEVRPGRIELERRHHVDPVYVDRPVQVWVEPVYQTVPGQRVWVEPTYRTVVDRVWREGVTREERVQVLAPAGYEYRDVVRYGRLCRERVFVPEHYILQCRPVVVVPGHFEDVTRQELVTEGHYECGPSAQVIVTPGHFETRATRVLAAPGHWEDRPVVVVRP